MSCLREVQTISKSPDILPMPSLTRLTTGGVLNPLKNTTNTSHNELLHQDPLQPPLEPRRRAGGKPQLSARFVEWMMGLPDGHVTGPDLNLSRERQLRMLGNGVVPQQAALAVHALIHTAKDVENDQF